jgi:hypothetical protein
MEAMKPKVDVGATSLSITIVTRPLIVPPTRSDFRSSYTSHGDKDTLHIIFFSGQSKSAVLVPRWEVRLPAGVRLRSTPGVEDPLESFDTTDSQRVKLIFSLESTSHQTL